MKTAIISGSQRNNSQSWKVSEFLSRRLNVLSLCSEAVMLDLSTEPVGFWKEEAHLTTAWSKHYAEIKQCDSYIIVTPEWDGMAPPALKNFFHMFHAGELAHKPALLVGVSGGINGVYPIAELRMGSYKNTRICYLPENVIVRNAAEVLNSESEEGVDDIEKELRQRIDYTLTLLNAYAGALGKLRNDFDLRLAEFPFGV